MGEQQAESRQRGRPRSEASRQAVLDATLRLLAAGPYEELTVERIAAEAGVGKQTIYRWWRNKANVVLEALLTSYAEREAVPMPDTGDLRADLTTWMRGMISVGFDDRHVGMTRSLMAAVLEGTPGAESERQRSAQESGTVMGWLRTDLMPWMRGMITLGLDDPFVGMTRNAVAAALGRDPDSAAGERQRPAQDSGTVMDRLRTARDRGEIRPDADLAAAASALTDPLAFHIVIGKRRSQEWGDGLVDIVVRGLT